MSGNSCSHQINMLHNVRTSSLTYRVLLIECHFCQFVLLKHCTTGDYPPSASLSGVELSQKSRRLSTRSIKRKKFDDELVESSLIKSDRARPRQPSASETRLLLPGPSIGVSSVVTERIDVPIPPAAVERKKVHKVCNVFYSKLTCNMLKVKSSTCTRVHVGIYNH